MTDSILNTIKKLLGAGDGYDYFDVDIITHINTALFILYQIGVSDTPFTITGESETWSDFLGSEKTLELVKSYIVHKVRMLFDPPTGNLIEATTKLLEELEWRISVEVDPKR